MTALAPPRLLPEDLELLERRARELAAGGGPGGNEARDELQLVAFRLRGRACAVDARVVERAVARLARPIAVPLAAGGERLVVFVDERPVALADLAGIGASAPRGGAELEGQPAILVAAAAGPVAVAVEGPLELLEDRLAGLLAPGDPAELRAAGVLAGGATVLDSAWLQEWAGRTVKQ